jgi:dynein heavy chain
MWTTNVEAAL